MNQRILVLLLLTVIGLPVFTQEPVKIGLLIQDKTSLAAQEAAELAIRSANEKGGFNGRPFQLITKSMEGPWGTGSKQAVSLIFENDVWALIGSHDGRNAHLVEQASTKSIVSFVSVWSSDPTLSQAYVPWFFNCVPNDEQQAEAFLTEIFDRRKLTRIVTINDDAYDSNQSLKGFVKILNSRQRTRAGSIIYNKNSFKPEELRHRIVTSRADAVVIFCQPASALMVVRALRQSGLNLPVFGTLSILNENALTGSEMKEFQQVLFPSDAWDAKKGPAFIRAYRIAYARNPGMVAAYSFDGMNLLIKAIKEAGSADREKIQEAMRSIIYEGVTGIIRFDNLGIRQGIPGISHLNAITNSSTQ